MIGASKILTVSYGTFSCTLEGFDDPFNTMKAIAEYFRDLAAGDRYFGAEPPTPDTAMLHRIAEREVQRRVEAKVQDNGVILRAQYDEPPSTMPLVPAPTQTAFVDQPVVEVYSPAPDVLPATDTAAPVPAQHAVEPAVADLAPNAPFTQPKIAQPALSGMPEGVAARLAKIRAAVALTEAAPQTALASDYAEDQHADTAFGTVEIFEESVVPSVSDVSFASPEDPDEFDETENLAALDGVPMNTLLADAAFVENAAAPGDDHSTPQDASDTIREDLYLATDNADDPAFVDGDGDHDDMAHDDLAQDQMLDDAKASTIPTPAETAAVTPAAMPVDDAYDDVSDEDVLANLSAAFAENPCSPADSHISANADTIGFSDDEDMLLAELTDAPDEPDHDIADLSVAAANDKAPAAVLLQDDDLQEEDFAENDSMIEAAMDAEQPAYEALLDDTQVEGLPANDPLVEMVEPVEDEPLAVVLPVVSAAEAAPLAKDPVLATAMTVATAVAPADAAREDEAFTATANDKLQRARARIIRVRRAPEPVAVPAPAIAPAILSDEAEAELQRELEALEEATVEAQATANAAAITDADDELRRQLGALSDDDTPASVSDFPAKPLDPSVQDESLRRLMDQTQSEMAEPSNRRRLSSIAHLKAAVAATIAERFGTKPKPVEEVEAVRTEPYRNDLARAVRPVRPESATNPGQTERPAPLVLVSEQRIDRPALATTTPTGPVIPVRPRRVSAQAVAVQNAYEDEDFDAEEEDTDNIFGDAKGFAEFADRIGANNMSELLEAAAAYSAAVEGREHFTRPQLLRQIAYVTGAEVSREDELRGFGNLLRDGRIVKVRRGQFALTETSSYLNEARKLSG